MQIAAELLYNICVYYSQIHRPIKYLFKIYFYIPYINQLIKTLFCLIVYLLSYFRRSEA